MGRLGRQRKGVRQGAAEGEWHKARKRQSIVMLLGCNEEQEGQERAAGARGERCEV